MIFTRVSVLIPTRKRLERLNTLLNSFEQTTAQKNSLAELIFRVDNDDYETQEFLLPHVKLVTNTRRYGNIKMIIGPRYNGYDSMPIFFNEMWPHATGEVLMCGNDDMIFRTPNWPAIILDAANKYPDGIFDFGVKTLNEEHYPFSTVSKKIAEHLGFIWDPRIFWGDIFLRDTMNAFNRLVMLPSIEIDHDWAGFKPDHVFNEADKDIVRRNPTYWAEVHTPAVNDAVVKLRELIN